MTFPHMVTTFAGAFIFPFLLRLCVGKMVDEWGSIAGWMFAAFVVGTTWSLTHGVGFIFQSGTAWIDQAWAGAFGLFVASAAAGDHVGKGLTNGVFAIIGGTIGGFILSCL
ncbi:Lin0368 family putative glycerol transporter subunit [Crassaminicella profunda]|uniref:Lin0368 family putative glycerol transporter subunit n=1 Tax=Crassaminicella profunda TaxID=1286698 RepID=UPI001CA706FB|nr:hypothetical protein [Crassaminicella profunda]QZY53674.1 hypothetical protein K7H06_11440 [Crassaminicella profunda]